MTATFIRPAYLDRVLADSSDRENWLRVRADGVLGASDAANFAKAESVDLYAVAKLKSGQFRGNRYTESGNLWEPRMLAHFGIPQNTLLIHAEGEPGYAATPDGIEVVPSTGEVILAECKAIHDRIIKGPSRAFLRQMWWAQYCVGATRTKFIWQELVDGVPRRLEPHIVIVDRDDAEIRKLLRIAGPVLHKVRLARAYESEMLP